MLTYAKSLQYCSTGHRLILFQCPQDLCKLTSLHKKPCALFLRTAHYIAGPGVTEVKGSDFALQVPTQERALGTDCPNGLDTCNFCLWLLPMDFHSLLLSSIFFIFTPFLLIFLCYVLLFIFYHCFSS